MAKDPAFLFYPGDWLGGTLGMTFEEKGAYLELLMLQFNRGHMTSHMIGQTVGQLWVKIKDKFLIDDEGLFYNKRLEEEVEKRRNYVASRKNNIKGINQYSNKEGHTSSHTSSHMEGHTTGRMENEDEDEDISKNKGSEEGKKEDRIPYSKIQDLWNNTVKSLPKIERLTDGRKREIKTKYSEGGYELFERVFQKVEASMWLTGRTKEQWRGCSFDWVMKIANWTKIIEGNYDDKRPTGYNQQALFPTTGNAKTTQYDENGYEIVK